MANTFPKHTAVPANPFLNLPPLMKEILYREDVSELNIAIFAVHKLTEEQQKNAMGVIRKILLKTVEPKDLVQTLEHDLGLDAPAAVSLAIDLLGQRFLPMEFYLGPIAPLIRQLGGDPAPFLAAAQKRYPVVYSPQTAEQHQQAIVAAENDLLKNFEDRLNDFKGRAEILLRLTGMSATVEDRMKANQLSRDEGESLLADLEEVAAAVDTRDLSHLERQRLRRKLTRVVEAVGARA